MERIFIAGHGGLLGRHLVELLSPLPLTLLLRTRAELDLTDSNAVDAFFAKERPDTVFLCAGLTGGIQENLRNPATFLHVNLAIQDAVFEAAGHHGTRSMVFYGSSCMYPRHAAQPIPESALYTGALEPTSAPYAAAKLAGIAACEAYTRQIEGLRSLALIPNSMYGPGDHFSESGGHVLAALVARFHRARQEGIPEVVLWGSGQPTREFIHARDVAHASLFAVKNQDQMENHPYNLGTGVETRIQNLASLVADAIGYTGGIRWDTAQPDGAPRKCLDSRAFMRLGWTPTIELSAGIKDTCRWFAERAQP